MFKGKMASPVTTLGKQSNWFWSLTFEQGGLTSAWLYVWQWNGCMLGIRDGLTLALSSSVITPSSYLKMKLIQDPTFTYNNQWPLVYNELRGWMNDLYWPAWVLDWKVCCPAGLGITTLCSVALDVSSHSASAQKLSVPAKFLFFKHSKVLATVPSKDGLIFSVPSLQASKLPNQHSGLGKGRCPSKISHFCLYSYWTTVKTWHSWIYCYPLSSVPLSIFCLHPVPLPWTLKLWIFELRCSSCSACPSIQKIFMFFF